MRRLGKPHRLIVYPAFRSGAAQGHNIVQQSVALWESDVFAFLDKYLER